MTLLSYPNWNDDEPDRHTIINPKAQPSSTESIKLGVIGAGSFAVSMHLPIIRKMQPTVAIQAIVNRTGHKAQTIAQQNGAAYATTDVEKVFNDNDVDAVLITTRHDTHANLVLRALESGKHVLVEKPLALNEEELSAIETFYSTGDGEKPVLLTGFNRRFSPFALRAREIVSRRTSPMIINYRMNAGHIPSDHWVHGPEGGGRNVGEACHIYDLFTSLTDSRIEDVTARSIRPSGQHYRADDNFVATLRFDDGSIATLTYTSLGTNEHPKELMDVYADGKVICLHDYKELIVTGAKADGLATQLVDKGHQFEVESFFDVIRTGGDWPIPLWHQLQAMRIAFQIECLT
jgi:predicted dehydrogenase